MTKDNDRVWPELPLEVQGIKSCLDQLAKQARGHGLARAAELISEASEAILDDELELDLEQEPKPSPPPKPTRTLN